MGAKLQPPRKKPTKTQAVSVRLTEEELRDLDRLVEHYDSTRADTLRAILETYTPPLLRDIDRENEKK